MASKLNPRAPSFVPENRTNLFYNQFPNYVNPILIAPNYLQIFPTPLPPPPVVHGFHHDHQFHGDPTVVTRPRIRPSNRPVRPNPSRSLTTRRSYDSVDRVRFSRGGFGRATWMRRPSQACESSKTSSSLSRVEVNDDHGSDVTSLMIRNIPSKYTRKMVMNFLDNHCMRQNQSLNASRDQDHGHYDDQKNPASISAYDFLYLPIDFRSKLNKGYAFVNFTSPQGASKFAKATSLQKWAFFQSSKIREIAIATIQGKDQLVKHFEKVRFGCEDEEFLPVWFSPPRDGFNKDLVTAHTVGNPIGFWKNKHNN